MTPRPLRETATSFTTANFAGAHSLHCCFGCGSPLVTSAAGWLLLRLLAEQHMITSDSPTNSGPAPALDLAPPIGEIKENKIPGNLLRIRMNVRSQMKCRHVLSALRQRDTARLN